MRITASPAVLPVRAPWALGLRPVLTASARAVGAVQEGQRRVVLATHRQSTLLPSPGSGPQVSFSPMIPAALHVPYWNLETPGRFLCTPWECVEPCKTCPLSTSWGDPPGTSILCPLPLCHGEHNSVLSRAVCKASSFRRLLLQRSKHQPTSSGSSL